MNRSLLTIFLMGVIAMLLLSMFGSFFVGKVGGAENVLGLKKDIREVFASSMADPEALKVKVVIEGERTGLLVEYPINPATAGKESAFRFHRQRLVTMIYGRSYWRKRCRFVLLRITLPGGKVHEERFPNPSRPV